MQYAVSEVNDALKRARVLARARACVCVCACSFRPFHTPIAYMIDWVSVNISMLWTPSRQALGNNISNFATQLPPPPPKHPPNQRVYRQDFLHIFMIKPVVQLDARNPRQREWTRLKVS